MKVFETYHKLYEGFKEGVVPFCVIQEIASAVSESAELSVESPQTITEAFAEDIYTRLEDTEENSFSWLVGGDVFLCETEEDLKQIKGCDFEWAKAHNDEWPSVVDLPMSWDACDYVMSDPDTEWVIFLLCWSNAGGPSYYVPKSLWEAARFEEHYKLHNEHWSSNASH